PAATALPAASARPPMPVIAVTMPQSTWLMPLFVEQRAASCPHWTSVRFATHPISSRPGGGCPSRRPGGEKCPTKPPPTPTPALTRPPLPRRATRPLLRPHRATPTRPSGTAGTVEDAPRGHWLPHEAAEPRGQTAGRQVPGGLRRRCR